MNLAGAAFAAIDGVKAMTVTGAAIGHSADAAAEAGVQAQLRYTDIQNCRGGGLLAAGAVPGGTRRNLPALRPSLRRCRQVAGSAAITRPPAACCTVTQAG
ncbi:hypothetical protein MJ585_11605 [Klebsiella pneumoniae]|nr:hypothetical protein MJ585_11605 [Klebsiella pneumoniae]